MSLFSGCVSILLILFLLLIGVILTLRMTKKSEMQWNQNTYQTDLTTDTTPLEISPSDGISLRLVLSINPSVQSKPLNASFKENNFRTYDENANKVLEDTQLGFHECTEYDFPEKPLRPDFLEYQKDGMILTACFNISDVLLKGNDDNFLETSNVYLRMKVLEEARSLFSYAKIFPMVEIRHKYVDLSDLKNPIKYQYHKNLLNSEGRNFLSEVRGFRHYQYQVNRNEIELQDTWWDFIFSPDKKIMNNINTDYEITHYDFSSIEYAMSFQRGEITYQFGRRVLNFLEVTGVIGGLFEILDIFIGMIIGYLYSFSIKKEIKKSLLESDAKLKALEAKISESFQSHPPTPPQNNPVPGSSPSPAQVQPDPLPSDSQSSLEESKCPLQIPPPEPIHPPPAELIKPPSFLKFKPFESFKSPFSSSNKNSDKFLKENLDCVDLIYSIKTLEMKVKFLMDKQSGFEGTGHQEIKKMFVEKSSVIIPNNTLKQPKLEKLEKSQDLENSEMHRSSCKPQNSQNSKIMPLPSFFNKFQDLLKKDIKRQNQYKIE